MKDKRPDTKGQIRFFIATGLYLLALIFEQRGLIEALF